MERHEFLEILTEQIRTKRARPFIAKEIEGHIEDQKMDFMAEGMTDLEAEEAAVREMGDPVEAGVALDRIHRPRMKWSVLTGILLISILGLILQMTVTMTACESGFSGSLLLSAGGVGRHLTAMAAGIALMLCICWADYTLLNKYAVILWVAVNGLLILCAVESPLINGRPFYLTHASCLIIPFYAGMPVYSDGCIIPLSYDFLHPHYWSNRDDSSACGSLEEMVRGKTSGIISSVMGVLHYIGSADACSDCIHYKRKNSGRLPARKACGLAVSRKIRGQLFPPIREGIG